MLYSKLHFHRHIDYTYSHALKMIGQYRFVTYNFSTLDSYIYIFLFRSELEYESVAWKNLILVYCNKMEKYEKVRKFMFRSIYSVRFSSWYSILNYLNPRTIYSRRQHLDALLLVTFPWIKSTVVLLWTLLVSMYPLSKLRTFKFLILIMIQNLVLHQGSSQLQRASEVF
jgi:hypothetical protein